MGLIKRNAELDHHFLTNYGYKYSLNGGPQGEPGFTRTYIHADGSERLWVTVDIEHNKVHLYNEFECGGLLSQQSIDIPDSCYNYCGEKHLYEYNFINWLDKQTPDD